MPISSHLNFLGCMPGSLEFPSHWQGSLQILCNSAELIAQFEHKKFPSFCNERIFEGRSNSKPIPLIFLCIPGFWGSKIGLERFYIWIAYLELSGKIQVTLYRARTPEFCTILSLQTKFWSPKSGYLSAHTHLWFKIVGSTSEETCALPHSNFWPRNHDARIFQIADGLARWTSKLSGGGSIFSWPTASNEACCRSESFQSQLNRFWFDHQGS